MSYPPHLPAPSCNIEKHRKWQRIKILLAATVFGLAAGLSGAAMMLGWIWPGLGGGDTWIVARTSNFFANHNQLSDQARREIDERVATVYKEEKNLKNIGYLADEDKIGEAAILTSDGWATMYYSGDMSQYKKWRLLFADGSVYIVSKIIPDYSTQMVYFKLAKDAELAKISGAQFKVTNFSTDPPKANSELFIYEDGGWRPITFDRIVSGADTIPHADFAPAQFYGFSSNAAAGTVVIDAQGRVAGFGTKRGVVLPASYLVRVLDSILSKQKIAYPTLGIEGWYDFERPIIINEESAAGFMVSKGNDSLRPGDVITSIEGKIVSEDNLWYNMVNNKTARLQILRAGKSMEVQAAVILK